MTADLVAALRTAGCLVLGVTTMPELALHPYGPARNPWDLSRTAGGSSSGSAAAVAAGLIPAATASDGGGSIRIPAASCGLFGLKPTPGLLPSGPEPQRLARAVGARVPHARGLPTAALLMDAVCGTDALPPGGCAAELRRSRCGCADAALRIAVSDGVGSPGAARGRLRARGRADTARRLGGAGHTVPEPGAEVRSAWRRRSSRVTCAAPGTSAVRLVDPQLLAPAARGACAAR